MKKAVFVVCFALSFINVSAQKAVNEDLSYSLVSKHLESELLSKAYKSIGNTEPLNSANNYLEILKKDPSNLKANYGLGLALYVDYQQPKSVYYIEKVIRQAQDSLIEANFFLGNAYHLSGQYGKAKQYYEHYLLLLNGHVSFLSSEDLLNSQKDVSHRLEMCEKGLQLLGSSPLVEGKPGKKIGVSMIGDMINTESDDFGAIFCSKDSLLYYTSRRVDDGDIYASSYLNGAWQKVTSIDQSINTRSYETVINASSDGNRIYFYRSGIEDGTVYYSDKKNGSWNVPLPLLTPDELKSTFQNTRIYSFALNSSRTELFIVSDRKGGFGGKDIYVSKRDNDTSTWRVLENLGPKVNSAYDEVALDLSKDDQSLYFSSNNSNSIGGFDVFVSHRQNKVSWTAPLNLGTPINTPADDLFFTFLNSGERACYSSGGHSSEGRTDLNLYYVDYCDEIKENTIKGVATGFSNGEINVINSYTKKPAASVKIVDGKYSLSLPVGMSYVYEIITKGISPVYAEFVVPFPSECKRYDIYQELSLSKPGDTLKMRSSFLNPVYESKNQDVSTYSGLLTQEDKSKLKYYKEVGIRTYASSVISTSVYDSASGKLLSKTELDGNLLNANNGNLKAAYEKQQSKQPSGSTSITTISFANTLFEFNKSSLKPGYKGELDKAVKFLQEVKPEGKIEINGYTDSKGSARYNASLSKKRAQAVANYLISKKISKKRITVTGMGEANPLAPNTNADGSDNPAGRSQNRRTELIIK